MRTLFNPNEHSIAHRVTVLLWKFRVKAMDLRSGETVTGGAVIIGNSNNDVEQATRELENEYAAIGYELIDAEYEAQKVFTVNTADVFNELEDDTRTQEPKNGYISKSISGERLKSIEVKEIDKAEPETEKSATELALLELKEVRKKIQTRG